MKKLGFAAVAVIALGSAYAMLTKQEIAETRPLVSELMAPVMADFKSKAKTAVEVADASVAFADSAKSEAARFLFLRGAVSYYVKDGEFGKAADAVEALKAKVKDVPPAEIADIISGALGRGDARKAPRLQSHLQLAQAQVRAAKDVGRLAAQLKQISTDPVRRQYAEALALSGNWNAALAEFSKVSGSIGKTAKYELSGTASAEELGDFWWGYETSYAGGGAAFRERAVNYYRKAIAGGKVDGLKKTLIERRLASLTLPDTANAVADGSDTKNPKADEGKQTPSVGSRVPRDRAAKNPAGLVHRWSFADGFADSVGNVAPSKSDNATVENDAVLLRSGSPLEFPAGTVPLAPFTIQVWASATDKGLGSDGNYIFKIASSPDSKDAAYWTWRAGTKWVQMIGGHGASQAVGHGTCLVDGETHLYTVTGEKSGKGVLLKFYQDDTCFGELTAKFAWKKPPMLILGGFVTPTYDEVRVYSRALSHAEIITSANEGPDKLPEGK